jgi:hypothetical protein
MRAAAQITLFVHGTGDRADDQLAARIRRIWRIGAKPQWPLMKWPSPLGRRLGWLGQVSRGAASAKGSLGTLCPRLPRLLTGRISSGLAGEELHGRDKGGPGRGMA